MKINKVVMEFKIDWESSGRQRRDHMKLIDFAVGGSSYKKEKRSRIGLQLISDGIPPIQLNENGLRGLDPVSIQITVMPKRVLWGVKKFHITLY